MPNKAARLTADNAADRARNARRVDGCVKTSLSTWPREVGKFMRFGVPSFGGQVVILVGLPGSLKTKTKE